MFNITALLQTERELDETPPGDERDAKVNLLKYCQVDTVKKYRRIADGLYFDLVQGGGLCHLRQVLDVKGDLVQPMQTGSIEDYLRHAENAKGCLDTLVREVARGVGGEVFTTRVKTLDSTRRKVENVGDIRKVTDMARATVVCDTPEDLAHIYELLTQRLPNVRRRYVLCYKCVCLCWVKEPLHQLLHCTVRSISCVNVKDAVSMSLLPTIIRYAALPMRL